MIEMIEPTDPAERALAIRICRANAWLKPEDGMPQQDDAVAKETWRSMPYLSSKKWLWMWNHGRAEWHPEHPSARGDSSG